MEIETRKLKAVQLFAAKRDVRHYLNGICVRVHESGSVALIATDGSSLMAVDVGEQLKPPAPNDYIIPSEAILALGSATVTKVHILGMYVTLQQVENGNLTTQEWKLIDGEYPEVTRVIPSELSGEVFGGINIKYLTLANKALKILLNIKKNDYFITLKYAGDSPIVVHTSEDVLILIMPTKSEKPIEYKRPVWL